MKFLIDKKFKKIPDYLTYKAAFLILTIFITYSLLLSANSMTIKLSVVVIFMSCLIHFALNVLHEAHHGLATNSKKLNDLLIYGFDVFFGISSKLYRIKHSVHHKNTNIESMDEDLDTLGLLRMTPHQTYYFYHKLQPYYALLVYASLTITWPLVDLKRLILRFIGSRKINLKNKDYASIIALKLIHYFIFLYIPFKIYGNAAIMVYILLHIILGIFVSLISLVAHIGTSCETYDGNKKYKSWYEGQVRSTASFRTESFFLNLILGGANYHVVHHIYPGVPTIYYKEVNEILKKQAIGNDINIIEFDSFFSAISDHFKRLKVLSSSNKQRSKNKFIATNSSC